MALLWEPCCLVCLSEKKRVHKFYASVHTGSFSVISKETHPFPAGFRFFNPPYGFYSSLQVIFLTHRCIGKTKET